MNYDFVKPIIAHAAMRLGKLAPRRDQRLLMLTKYTVALPPSPETVDYSGKLSALGVMGNDRLGDCTCAAVGHVIQTWTANAGTQAIISDDEVLSLYEKACGYNPSNPSTDLGGVETDVLNYWRKNPDVVGGHELAAYAAVEPGNHADVQDAVWLFGAAYIGLALPLSCQSQDVWTVPANGASGQAAPGSWGGHAVPVIGYDARGLTCITWGGFKRMTWNFWDTYCDEAYGLIGKDWIAADGNAPSGFALAALMSDLASI